MFSAAQCRLLTLAGLLFGISAGEAVAQERWNIQPRRSVGHFGGSIEFGSVTAVTLGPLGIYVGDGMNARVVVLDSLLQPITSLGRRGSGPGEFRSIKELTVRADTIYVYDLTLRRLTAVTAAGESVWTQKPIPRMADESADPHPGTVLADGAILVRGRAQSPSPAHGLHRFPH